MILTPICRYSLDASETFLPNLLQYCYTTPINELSPRRLALLLMVLSIGSLVDLNRPLGYLYVLFIDAQAAKHELIFPQGPPKRITTSRAPASARSH